MEELFFMQQSLVGEVKKIEQLSSDIIASAKASAEKELMRVTASVSKAKADSIAKAKHTSASIISEHTTIAEDEAHKIVQESKNAASSIHATAEKNRARTVAKAMQLFENEYQIKNS